MQGRPRVLDGATYELKLDHLEDSIFMTVNHQLVDNVPRIHELFINSFDGEQLAWTPLASRLVSAVLRQGGDTEFLFTELKDMFSVTSFFYKGQKYPSIMSLIGEILDNHQQQLIKNYEKDNS